MNEVTLGGLGSPEEGSGARMQGSPAQLQGSASEAFLLAAHGQHLNLARPPSSQVLAHTANVHVRLVPACSQPATPSDTPLKTPKHPFCAAIARPTRWTSQIACECQPEELARSFVELQLLAPQLGARVPRTAVDCLLMRLLLSQSHRQPGGRRDNGPWRYRAVLSARLVRPSSRRERVPGLSESNRQQVWCDSILTPPR